MLGSLIFLKAKSNIYQIKFLLKKIIIIIIMVMVKNNEPKSELERVLGQ